MTEGSSVLNVSFYFGSASLKSREGYHEQSNHYLLSLTSYHLQAKRVLHVALSHIISTPARLKPRLSSVLLCTRPPSAEFRIRRPSRGPQPPVCALERGFARRIAEYRRHSGGRPQGGCPLPGT